MSVRIRDKNRIPELIGQLKSLSMMKVIVGVTAPSGDIIYTVAHVHEYGISIRVTDKMRGWFLGQGIPLRASTTHIKIPERSFIRSGFDANKGAIEGEVEKAVDQVLQGDVTAYEAREIVGEFASKKIRDNVTGVGLVKTGKLRDSIGFKVGRK